MKAIDFKSHLNVNIPWQTKLLEMQFGEPLPGTLRGGGRPGYLYQILITTAAIIAFVHSVSSMASLGPVEFHRSNSLP